MVMATLASPGPAAAAAAAIVRGGNTPTKRPVNPIAPFPATKKQRSYDYSNADILKKDTPDDGGYSIPTLTSNIPQLVKLEQPDTSLLSPLGLKSSLKTKSTTSNLISNALDSPTESDKRGMYSEFVQAALDDRNRGKEVSYQELVSQFRAPSPRIATSLPTIPLLQTLLHALSNVASRLDRRNHTILVDNILTLPWATMGGDSFARTWMRFVCTLCSARSEWVGEVLSRAIRGLSYRSDWRSMAYQPPGTSSSRPTRRIIYSRIHSLLRSLLSLIPTLPTQLAPLVLRHYPHKREGIKEHVVYIRNMFEMCEYAEELRPGVLECVLGRAVEIDVEIQIELDELEEAEASLEETMSDATGDEMREVEDKLQMDLLDKPLDEDSDSDDGEDDDEWQEGFEDIQSDDDADQVNLSNGKSEQVRTAQIRLLVNKLDAIMETMFQQLDATDNRFLRVCKGLDIVDSALTPARAIHLRNNQFTDLMTIFTKMLLPTFKSRHVQFVLFWFASLDQDFGDLFLGLLLSKAIYSTPREEEDRIASEEVPMIMRVASASYVASLVSRAKYINKRDARTVMLNLCAFLEAHLDAYGSGWLASSIHMQRMDDNTVVGPHSLFYAVCQACFYIFCFRWRDLQLKDDEEQEEGDVGEEIEADEILASQASTQTSKWCDGLEAVKRAILSNLNPLANCSPAVAEQFAGVAQLTGFLYCWSLIEKNSRNSGSPKKATSTSSSKNNNSAVTSINIDTIASPIKEPGQKQILQANTAATRKELDSFFPFDPYRLRASTKWVEPLYREWSDVAPEGMLDDDDDDDDDDEEEEEEGEDGSDTSSSTTSDKMPNRSGLKIPKIKHSAGRDRFNSSSASTNDDQIAQSLNSLEAMSISPFRSR